MREELFLIFYLVACQIVGHGIVAIVTRIAKWRKDREEARWLEKQERKKLQNGTVTVGPYR